MVYGGVINMDRDDEVVLGMVAVLVVIALCYVCFNIGYSISKDKLQTLCDKKQYDFCVEQKQWEIKVD